MNDIFDAVSMEHYVFVSGVLFALGLIGFLTRRNMIVMFLCAELMLQGVSLNLLAWGRFHGDWGGQILTIFIITVAACEAGIALAMIIMLFQRRGKLDIADWQTLRESNQPVYVDENIPEESRPPSHWPHLSPAGVEPQHSEEETTQRPHV